MEKIWFKCYLEGMFEIIDFEYYYLLFDLFEKSFVDYSDFLVFINMGKVLIYSELDSVIKCVVLYI